MGVKGACLSSSDGNQVLEAHPGPHLALRKTSPRELEAGSRDTSSCPSARGQIPHNGIPFLSLQGSYAALPPWEWTLREVSVKMMFSCDKTTRISTASNSPLCAINLWT